MLLNFLEFWAGPLRRHWLLLGGALAGGAMVGALIPALLACDVLRGTNFALAEKRVLLHRHYRTLTALEALL